ncbi:hypothetical protein EHQ52_00810 [Leptospira koniambonensis]|uniref:Uncharacterized protein n=1 Tax=Leptospira koniambonensis TaxID=2484950 RepID=A0A4R9JD41_9LEPT|nr:hypothetical protein [Leptospira koniambonensis]TGL36448.1 hypothetical protein EHQ52_00810 [Leptospira koniambonensis]
MSFAKKVFAISYFLFCTSSMLYSSPYVYNDFSGWSETSPLTPDYSKYSPKFYNQESSPVNTAETKDLQKEKERVELRRSMLDWHQVLGLATWAFWLTTNLVGEQALSNLKKEYEPYANYLLISDPQKNLLLYTALMKASPWDSESSGSSHAALAGTTFTLYAITAGLAFFSPSKSLEREPGLSTIFTHKAMIWIHLPAMLALPLIGERISKEGPSAANEMRAVGWAGFGAFSVSIAVFYF